MNVIIKFLVKRCGYRLHADTIYTVFKTIPINEFISYAQEYANYCGKTLEVKEIS